MKKKIYYSQISLLPKVAAMVLELNIVVPSKEWVEYVSENEVDIGEKSSIKGPAGGWKSAILLLVNQGLATLAFFGVGVNLVLFLTRVLEYDNAEATNHISKWTGTVYLFSLVGAFLSDSYWGRYLTCIIFQIIFLLGLVLLSLSSWLFLIKPRGCGDGDFQCQPTTLLGDGIFYVSIYLIALGYGGYQPAIATFGSDQFNEADPVQKHSKEIFFCYFYFALNTGSLFSNTILVYFEDRGHWVIGFLASAGSTVLGILLFCLGTPRFRYMKACGNSLTRVAQVGVATVKKWSVSVPYDDKRLFELEGFESAIKGSRKILHSEELRFLDKAATLTNEDFNGNVTYNPWRLCTVTQVEEVKRVMKLLPIWLCTIIYSVIFTQMASIFVEQGDVMRCMFGNLRLPAASMSVFDIISVLMCTIIYHHLLIPVTRKITGNPEGLSELQRMGVGLVIGILAMVAAGITEIQRRRYIIVGQKSSTLSILWQVPQYMLVGASEVFMYVAQLDFFNDQAPDGLKSFGSSLCMASMSLGNYVSSMIVAMVTRITAPGDKPGWIPADLNYGYLERFYFLIAALAVVGLVVYLFCAKWYKCTNVENGDDQVDNNILRKL